MRGYFPASDQVIKNGVQSTRQQSGDLLHACARLHADARTGALSLPVKKRQIVIVLLLRATGGVRLSAWSIRYVSGPGYERQNHHAGYRKAAPPPPAVPARHSAHTPSGAQFCSIFTAVCAFEVVAPPINKREARHVLSLRQTLSISSSDGVISPERPIRSAFTSLAVRRIFCRHHNAEIDNFVVTLQHHTNDIFTDVVDVPFTVAITGPRPFCPALCWLQ